MSGAPVAELVAPVATIDIHSLPVTATDEERKVLAEFKGRVKDAMARCCPRWRSDSSLLRVLRAHKLDIVSSENAYRALVNWRAEVGADTILDTYKEPEVMKRYFPQGHHGVDRDGYPVLIERPGKTDLVGIYEALGETEFLRAVIYNLETKDALLQQTSAAAGTSRDAFTLILDFHGAKMSGKVMKIVSKLTKIREDYYPEYGRRSLMIRAPKVMTVAFGVLKHVMNESTREKMQILGDDYMSTLAKYIAPDQIPQSYGGTCACLGDPTCSSKLTGGGVVPASLRAGLPASSETVDIKSGLSDVSYNMVTAGSKVTWSFKASGDVNFFAFFMPAHVTLDTSNPCKLNAVPSSCVAIGVANRTSGASGEYTAAAEGSVALVWDNTSSWIKGRSVIRTIDVIDASGAAASSDEA